MGAFDKNHRYPRFFKKTTNLLLLYHGNPMLSSFFSDFSDFFFKKFPHDLWGEFRGIEFELAETGAHTR
jgi:hypothetical protein